MKLRNANDLMIKPHTFTRAMIREVLRYFPSAKLIRANLRGTIPICCDAVEIDGILFDDYRKIER